MKKAGKILKQILCGVGLLGFLLVFLTMPKTVIGADEKPIKIRLSSSGPATEFEGDGTTSAGVTAVYFAKEIDKRTNGRITVQFFPGGQLSSSPEEFIGGMTEGAFDMIILNNGSWSDFTNAFAGLNIPYLYFDFETAYAVLDSEIGKSWQKKAQEETGVICLAWIDIGFRELTNSLREIKTPDDVKGLKLRTMVDDIQMETWKLLGAAVTPVPYAELYTALQQKLVDGQENPVSNITAAKFYEMQPYMTMTNHNFTASIFGFSPVLWAKLSPEDQKLIRELAIEAQNKGREKTQILKAQQEKIIADYGVKIYYPTAEELEKFQEKIKPVWAKVEKNMGTEDFNKLINFVKDYTEKHKK
jgi:tripartite ATP-independent transporter DctP family solute receptor